MLIAEIRGKVCPQVEGIEDLITSAVFGHLRSVRPNPFWALLLRRAINADTPPVSLTDEIQHAGIDFEFLTDLEVRFWPDCTPYGEPDIILCFSGSDVPSVIVLIEVKLDSGKSSNGDGDDQLARYLRLLDDHTFNASWNVANSHRFVVYLTRVFARQEIQVSVSCLTCQDARRRIFGLEWNDILETAYAERAENILLAELAEFLKRRGLSRFRGFAEYVDEPHGGGSFYQSGYFDQERLLQPENFRGTFYGD